MTKCTSRGRIQFLQALMTVILSKNSLNLRMIDSYYTSLISVGKSEHHQEESSWTLKGIFGIFTTVFGNGI